MKIAIAVQGRFHAFDLARALIAQGHDVTVFTNYPHWATRKFNLKDENVRSCCVHGVAVKALHRFSRFVPSTSMCRTIHASFGKWVAAQTGRESWDVVHMFSGIAEETLTGPRTSTLRTLVRGSAHIVAQDRLLADEADRAACAVERPASWMIEREQREYESADKIFVLSTFARNTFIEQGVPKDRLYFVPSGVEASRFRPSRDVIESRCSRIRAGEPLRVLFVGTFSLQKGIIDFAAFVRALDKSRFRFRFIGHVPSEGKYFQNSLKDRVEFIPRQFQSNLPEWYGQADIFVFPTIQDGFSAVLAQATGNSLPVLTTTNCSGPDLILNGITGWVLPIRRPDAFVERLTWCDEHRQDLADMVEDIYTRFEPRDWAAVATDYAAAYNALLADRLQPAVHA